MAENDPKALTTISSGSLKALGHGPKSIVSAMVSDALGLAHSPKKELFTAKFPIGGYSFCAPDYKQVLLWARALDLDPAEVIRRLESSIADDNLGGNYGFTVSNGSIITLDWDFNLLPLKEFEWIDGLLIEALQLKGRLSNSIIKSLKNLSHLARLNLSKKSDQDNVSHADYPLTVLDLPPVPSLTELWCDGIGLNKLDLSPLPSLISLGCHNNQLTQLNLSPVPGLKRLWCHNNQLTQLNLFPVPGLTELWCHSNQLTNLDLVPVPGLTELWCHSNQLTNLDLFPVPSLTELSAGENMLTHLDLYLVPGLTLLWCGDNELTKLDLSSVLGLTTLWCDTNQLTELDLSPVLDLTELWCGANSLTTLDVRHLSKLETFHADNNVNIKKRPDQENEQY